MLRFPEYVTAESVTSGHPDKVCDQISDAILDACLAQDPMSRVAVETFGSHGLLVIGGEITTHATIDAEAIARRVYRAIGYADDLDVRVHIVQQSPDIAMGVDTGGAGDQGIMYGYATHATPEYMPKAITLAHRLTRGLEALRRSGRHPWLQPDGKAQVTLQGDRVMTVLISTQHTADAELSHMRDALVRELIAPTIGEMSRVEVLVNPTGRFVLGGFAADTGLTGRKLMVDTYGGLISHGGGAFSGKDPTKVDRSAAYMARCAARAMVARGLAQSCLVSVAYAIGRAEPLMVTAVDEAGNDHSALVRREFDFRPLAIIERLGLRQPIYERTAAYGHFGRPEFPWERDASPATAAEVSLDNTAYMRYF
ncbi:methionine adenosyltransferase [Candidatus Uhrbacteria bacterium]|nr:methionine adenosyltransferase [Candidatus Uhrbacteria bacterium]